MTRTRSKHNNQQKVRLALFSILVLMLTFCVTACTPGASVSTLKHDAYEKISKSCKYDIPEGFLYSESYTEEHPLGDSDLTYTDIYTKGNKAYSVEYLSKDSRIKYTITMYKYKKANSAEGDFLRIDDVVDPSVEHNYKLEEIDTSNKKARIVRWYSQSLEDENEMFGGRIKEYLLCDNNRLLIIEASTEDSEEFTNEEVQQFIDFLNTVKMK